MRFASGPAWMCRTASEPELRAGAAQSRGADRRGGRLLPAARLLDEVFKAFVEPHLVQPTFVVDYPKALSPLAKEHRDDPALTERFELFVGGRELANAFSELNDPDDQRGRFEDQVRQREAGDDEAQQLRCRLRPGAGVRHAAGRRDRASGIDRLIMLLTDQPSIRDVILFPAMRPEGRDGRRQAAGAGSWPVGRLPECWLILRWPSNLEWRIARRYLRSRRNSTDRLAQHHHRDRRGGGRRHRPDRRAGRDERAAGRSQGTDSGRQPAPARPHLRAGLRLDDWRKVLAGAQPAGVVAAAPEVISQAGITAGQDYGEGVNLLGFDPDTGAHRSPRSPSRVTKGDLRSRPPSPAWTAGILLGSPAGLPAVGVSGRRGDVGARDPGQDQPGPGRRGAPVLEVRGDGLVRHRDVSVRQSVRGDVAGDWRSSSPASETRSPESPSG